MSRFRSLIENILAEVKIIKAEKPWRKGEFFNILKNPSSSEAEQFIKNTKYKAIRGIIYDDDIYIADAFIGVHDNLMDGVATSLGYDRWKDNLHWEAAFEIDDFNNLSTRGSLNDKFYEIFKNYNINTPHDISKGETYFDKEDRGLVLDSVNNTQLKEYDRKDPHDQYWNRYTNLNITKVNNEKPEIIANKTKTIIPEKEVYIQTIYQTLDGKVKQITYLTKRNKLGRTFDINKASTYPYSKAIQYINDNPEEIDTINNYKLYNEIVIKN